jgi:elongation factor 1 alpha-like protein
LVLIAWLQSAVAINCLEQFNAKAFFDDTPWLNTPPSRRARIVCQPSYHSRGLLGGSAQSEKMSKLAALAAKRRQKENARPAQAQESDLAATNDYVSSLRAVRLSSAPSNPIATEPDSAAIQKPANNNVDANPEKHSKVDTPHPREVESQVETKDLLAGPSAFANAIFGTVHQVRPVNLAQPILEPLLGSDRQAFDFNTPSPDDVVTKAQAAKGPR